MQDISNSLRQRLGARPEPQAHPDPDTLTAYMEQVLPATERAEIILHLSQCSYCREVVSLSLPQPESEQVVQPVPVRSGFWIPALRWGAALAMVAVAATLVVERPWKTVPDRTAQLAPQISQSAATSQPAPAPAPPSTPPSAPPSATTTTPATTTTASVTNGLLPTREARVPAVTAGLRSAVIPEPRPAKAAPPPERLGVVGGVAQDRALASTDQALEVMAMAPVTVSSPQPPTNEAANQDSEHDWVNTNALRNQRADQNGNGVSADAASLPVAPAPKFTNGRAISTPRLTAQNTQDQYNIALAPPNTTPASPPSAGDTNLAKSSFGYKLKSTIGSAVSAVKKASTVQSPHVSNGFASVMAAPNLKPADNESEAKAETAQQFHWRINPSGILMKSTDYTQWHEAYPQSSELQLKVLLTKGEQVWAGGNNATLIHSWNAGVNWETLRVPDSGDITAITVDDGWQVKTSNGQTFVSQDHGKTWVPLQAQPK